MTAMYDLVNCLHFPGFWRTSMTYLICINPAIVYDEVRLFIRYSSNCYFKIVQLNCTYIAYKELYFRTHNSETDIIEYIFLKNFQ